LKVEWHAWSIIPQMIKWVTLAPNNIPKRK